MKRHPTHVATRAAATALLVIAGAPLLALPAHADVATFEVMPADPLPAFDELKGDPPPQPSVVDVAGNPNFDQALQIAVTGSPTSQGLDGEYEITLGAKTAATVQAADAALATFWARRVEPTTGTGEATFAFERDGGSFKKSATAALQLSTEWREYSFPFRIAEDYAPGEAHFQLWLGYGPQTLQVAGVSVLDYGQGTPAAWPKVTYEGRDINAAWRAAANQRIDQYRKGDLTVHVVDPNGDPVSGAAVQVTMKRHAFGFGSAADGAHLLDQSAEGAKYRQVWDDTFNQGVLGNNLKWRSWENRTERDAVTYRAQQYMRGTGARTRAHNLVWGSNGHLPADVVALEDDPASLRARIDDHIADEASAMRGMADEWDVVNEPYSDHTLTDILGPTEIDNWYRQAHQADPDAKLFLNDYNLLEDNGWDTRQQDHDYNLARGMLQRGVPLQGIGMESHFSGLQLTPPQDLLPLVDRFAGLGIPVGITEFDVSTDDEQLQADYTRDFLTMMFSDPNVSEISTFGFSECNIWNPQVALYRCDWSVKPNGQVWLNLVNHRWWTRGQGTTDANGTSVTRGFLGDYLVTVTVDGVLEQARVSMPSNAGTSVTVVADGIQTLARHDIESRIVDGDFELGTKGWVGIGEPAGTTTDAHGGTTALRLSGGAGASEATIGLAAGTSYTLSAWGKSSAASGQCYVGVRGGPAPGQTGFQYVLTYGEDTSYAQRLLAFTPPDGTGWSQVFAWQNAGVPGDPTCTVDDVTLTPTVGIPPPAQAPPRIQPKLPGGANLALNGDMEAGSTTGWYCLGTCTLGLAGNPVHGGSAALTVTGRAANWTGAAQGVSVGNGGRYDSSMWVRLASPGTDTAAVALKLTTDTGSTTVRLGSATVTDTGWSQVRATGAAVAWTGTLRKAEWYVSTNGGGTEDLLVDDASFAPSNSPPAGQDLLANGDVESGKDGSWYCFSPCVASTVSTPVHSGARALVATNRTFNWTGPAQGVQVTNGEEYKSSAWVRLAAGAAPTTARIEVKLTMTDRTSLSVPIASGPVDANGWSQISGNNVRLSWSGTTLAKAEGWVSTTSGAADLYVDDAALQPAGPEATSVNTLVPTAACVVHDLPAKEHHGHHPRRAVDTYTAYFGYSNPNDFGIPIPIGRDNAVSPAPADRGQPVQFLPYQRPRRAAVTFPADGTVSWRLNGTTVSATASTPPCS